MKVIRKLFALTLILALSGDAQNTIKNNVQFTDVKGNSYDLYEELGKGKHVFVTFAKAQF